MQTKRQNSQVKNDYLKLLKVIEYLMYHNCYFSYLANVSLLTDEEILNVMRYLRERVETDD